MSSRHTDVVIVGSGVAGLSVALRLAANPSAAGLRVTLLSKSALGEGCSRLAQGGIACALAAGDSPTRHAEDTLSVAGGLGRSGLVRVLTREAPGRIVTLIASGMRFDRSAGGRLDLGLEGGHSRERVLHAGGDATGAELMRVLTGATMDHDRLEIFDHTRAIDLVVREGRVAGVEAVGSRGERITFEASAVILATGGFGHAYLKTTNPAEATGDAIAMSARAGAFLVDMEFVQFHPTALDVGVDPMPLLTEALRGAGSVLLDQTGRRFMPAVSPLAELAPRDVVARAIWARLAAGERIFLDARPALESREFPTAVTTCRDHGLELAREPVPISPAAHFTMGGVWVDDRGASSLRGLWVCGEAAGSGLHGANRLASNSLLEGLVFGLRVADDVLERLERPGPRRVDGTAMVARPAAGGRGAQPEAGASLEREIRNLLWERVGVVRTGHGLQTAIRELRRMGGEDDAGVIAPSLVTLGLAVATTALAREESRGGHCRHDFPSTDPGFRRHLIVTTDAAGMNPKVSSGAGGVLERSVV